MDERRFGQQAQAFLYALRYRILMVSHPNPQQHETSFDGLDGALAGVECGCPADILFLRGHRLATGGRRRQVACLRQPVAEDLQLRAELIPGPSEVAHLIRDLYTGQGVMGDERRRNDVTCAVLPGLSGEFVVSDACRHAMRGVRG